VRRVLVLGGPHTEAAALRERVVAAGGVAAVNVTASVTDVVCLAGGESDRRMRRIQRLGLPVQTVTDFLAHVDTLGALLPSGPGGQRPDGPDGGEQTRDEPLEPTERVLVRGAVVDLPRRARQDWTVTATWDWSSPGEVDLVAFLLGADERVESDEDMVFYNQTQAAEGAVALHVDGPAEQAIALELSDLPASVRRVVIAAALDGQGTFGDVGPGRSPRRARTARSFCARRSTRRPRSAPCCSPRSTAAAPCGGCAPSDRATTTVWPGSRPPTASPSTPPERRPAAWALGRNDRAGRWPAVSPRAPKRAAFPGGCAGTSRSGRKRAGRCDGVVARPR
jgi:hypothetical protein